MSRAVRREVRAALALALLAGGCVGRVVAVPVGADHPANPEASGGAFAPVRPEFQVETPAFDGAAKPAGSHAGHPSATPSGQGHETHRQEPPPAEPAVTHQHGAAPTPADRAAAGSPATETSATDPQRVDGVARSYVELSDALAADDFAAAAQHAGDFRVAAKELGSSRDPAQRDAGAELLRTGADAPKDIAALRESFKAWSPTVIELLRRTPQSRDVAPALREMYCPMLKASWLQESETVANPYYGATMRTCGSERSVIQARQEPRK